jgi:hypothetical protein
MNMGGAPSLLRNDSTGAHHWIRLKLVGTLSGSNSIGAQVRLTSGGRTQVQAVLSQSSFISQNDLRLHFGLGDATRVDRVEVTWPSGATQTAGPFETDRTVEIREMP